MEGETGYPEQKTPPEIQLQDGLRAYPLPEFRHPNRSGYAYGEGEPFTKEEATNKLNTLLEQIQQQGGDLKGFVTLDISSPSRSGRGIDVRPQQFAVVNKPSQSSIPQQR